MYKRFVKPIKSQSFFIFGARGTGKSTWLRDEFRQAKALWIDLLDEENYLRLTAHPEVFYEQCLNAQEWVVVDEIQRIPGLLNYVHKLIEEKKLKFALTGSSARKLKREGANLLAGRALTNSLHPLTYAELGSDFNLQKVLQYGSLPKIFALATDEERQAFLRAYTNNYIRQEVKEEQAVRKLNPFLRFLEVSAQMNGQILNYSAIARDCGVDGTAIERYYEILEDTLLGFHLEPFHESVRKRQAKRAKFYFFDLGVKRALERQVTRSLDDGTVPFGHAFEHFFILEVLRLRDYLKPDDRLSYLRTKDDMEIDLIIERPGESRKLIEVKSSKQVPEIEVRRLLKLKRDLEPCELWFASREKQTRVIEGAEILNWREVLNRLYA